MSDAVAITKPADEHWVRQWVREIHEGIAKPESAAVEAPKSSTVGSRALSTVGTLAETGIVGGIFGTAHATFGLDTPAGPADGWTALLGSLIDVFGRPYAPGLAEHARSISKDATAILTFRKAFEFMGGRREGRGLPVPGKVGAPLPPPGKGPGIAGEDPIVAAAKGLR